MDYNELRRRYPNFTYLNFTRSISGNRLHATFRYSLTPDLNFTHKVTFIFPHPVTDQDGLDNLVFHLGLSEMFSYWKLTCSPIVDIQAGKLFPDQIAFWHKLFLKGMGEYYYKNQINFTLADFLTLKNSADAEIAPIHEQDSLSPKQVLVPIGGGKDSLVTLELLRPHFDILPFIVNPVPAINPLLSVAQIPSGVMVERILDPQLLDLNKRGFLNGHVPISAFYAFASVLSAYVSKTKYIAFSNESSSNEGNTLYLGEEINHQYSKSQEFELDLSTYLHDLVPDLSYFSFLRPLSELQIAKIFSRLSQYFPVFTSCNTNFKLDPAAHPQAGALWCKTCPKCVSTALLLACFVGKPGITAIMGAYPPNLPENQSIVDDLLGKNPVKPFECVLTRAEANAAWEAVELGQPASLNSLLTHLTPSPNLPDRFAALLPPAV